MRFIHRIGKSTINQGITVPMECQDSWMTEIGKGQSIRVLFHVEDKPFRIDLRRIDNDKGHLQFRYERKEHESLRNYFSSLPLNGMYAVEVTEGKQGEFFAVPIVVRDGKKPRLYLYRPIYHNFSQGEFCDAPEFHELVESVNAIIFVDGYSQKDYNTRIREELSGRHWTAEKTVHDAIGLRCDFFKEGVWLEVEFGNARGYYQDYMKFLIAAKYQQYQCGVLLCPTASLANYLCDLGRERAQRKTDRARAVSYSGMMTYEKATRELPYLDHVLKTKVVIAGLDVSFAP